MDKSILIQTMRSQRQRWVTVVEAAEGTKAKRVQILMPSEMDVVRQFLKPGGGAGKLVFSADFEEVKKFTTNWDGFTEADLLGASVGASDAVPFDAELWELVAADHLAWVQAVAKALIDSIVERELAKGQDAKN